MRRPVNFILNQGHVEYELGVLMVWKKILYKTDKKKKENHFTIEILF